jgi:hypothetical protein
MLLHQRELRLWMVPPLRLVQQPVPPPPHLRWLSMTTPLRSPGGSPSSSWSTTPLVRQEMSPSSMLWAQPILR